MTTAAELLELARRLELDIEDSRDNAPGYTYIELRWQRTANALRDYATRLARPALGSEGGRIKQIADQYEVWHQEHIGMEGECEAANYLRALADTAPKPDESEVVKDAERYRWLCERTFGELHKLIHTCIADGMVLDDVIDTARKGHEG